MENPRLRDYLGDLWEVLPESGYVPRQDENWVREQTDEMRDAAATQTGLLVTQEGATEADASAIAWAQVYRETGSPRVYIREVPHDESSGTSATAGPRGVYELIGWAGIGDGPVGPGSMYRALVRPAARWYREAMEAAARDLANTDPEDEALAETRDNLAAAVAYNQRALAVALRHDRELSIDEMTQALTQEG